jgi:heptosyltransferase-2
VSAAAAGAGGVVVRLPNWLGDALMARPFLGAVRRRHAGERVTAVGPPGLLDLLAADGAWDVPVAWPPGPGAMGAVRATRPRTAYVLPPSFSSALLAWRWGAAERVGFSADGRDLLLTRRIHRPARGDRHLAREYLALAGEADGSIAVDPLATDAGAARVALELAGGPGEPYAVLAPGAAYGPAKRWPAERFAEVGRALASRGMRVLACGGPGDRAACDEVAAATGGARSLAGRTTLLVQAALCARAAVVVSNDSGMAHLAAAAGAPTVAVFGSTSSAWTAPLGPRVRVVQRAPVCSPCFRRSCVIGTPCLVGVSAARVLAAVDALLAPTSREAA